MGFILGPCPSCPRVPHMHLLTIWPVTSLTPSFPLPLWQEFQHSQWPPRPPAAAVHITTGCAGVPSNAETLLPSYQTTPCTPRSPPVRPAPPLTHTARLPRAQAVGRWLVVDGQPARPRDLFILCGAGGQVVGRAGEEDGDVFDSRGGLFAAPLRASRGRPVPGGVGVLAPHSHGTVPASIYII